MAGPFGALYSALSGLNSQGNNVAIITDNVVNTQVVGHKAKEGEFTTLVTDAVSSTAYSSGGVSIQTRSLVDKQGITQSTGNATDLAINGAGMFVLNSSADGTGQTVFSRSGSFRSDEKGNYCNASGGVLMGWQLDNNGKLPGEPGNANTTPNALIGSLTQVNFKSISGAASSTTAVKVGMTLDASQPYLKGGGETLTLPNGTSSLNNNIAPDALIIPSNIDGAGRLNLGDKITITCNPPGVPVEYTYGGISVSKNIGPGILGATTSGARFAGALNDQNFRITYGDTSATFTYTTSQPISARGQFSSMEDLATAINTTTGLRAKVYNNQLYIGTNTGTQAITFADVTGDFVNDLGLTNIAAASNRFSTLDGLKNIMNSTDGLTAITSSTTGGIDFYTTLPTSTLEIHGVSAKNTVTAANTSISNADIQHSKAVTITADKHGLTAGDYINITDFTGANGARLPNGLYMVTQATPTVGATIGTFTVNSLDIATGAAGPAIAANTSFKWQKAPGVIYTNNNLVNPNITTTTGANNTIVIDTGAAVPGVAAGDVIYISGYNNGAVPAGIAANLPDGYYNVTANTANSFTVVADAGAVTAAGGPTALGHALNYRKVGIGTAAALDTTPISTTQDSATVRVYMPHHGYQVNDIFTFNNIIGTPPITKNGIIFDNSTTFTIQTIDPAGNYFEYAATTNATATGSINADLKGVTVNEYTRMFTELGLDKLTHKYGPSYNAAGGTYGHNLAEGKINDSSLYVKPLSIYDSLGIEHNFRMAFAKLANNTWAAEIYAVKNTAGNFDIQTSRTDGQVAAGIIKFNGDGSLASVDSKLSTPVEIVWKNNALPSSISFDWGTAGVPQGTAGATVFGLQDGMKQVSAPFDQRFLLGNGIQPGLLNSISADKDGYLIAGFSNGTSKRIFRIPLAQFTNYNGLSEISGNNYTETNLSGSFNLRAPGTGGIGNISPQTLEQSNAELSTQLTQLIVAQKGYNACAKIISISNELLDTLDRTI